MNKITDIRPSPLAGRWYPAHPKKLAESVDSYIQAAQVPKIKGEILALISPHAGHQYSGPVAGYAFKTIAGLKPELVVILSPYHQYHPGAFLTSGHQAYQTPLGEVPLDQEDLEFVNSSLQDKIGIELSEVRNDTEHAVEIILPFLQRALQSEFSILPIMIRQQDIGLMQALGEILAELMLSRNVLLVASTDLSHFQTAGKAKQLDQTIIQSIQSLDPESLYQAQQENKGSACGLGALAAVIWAVKTGGSATAQILNYAHSGDITGDNTSVVGYTSAVLTRD
ncbi:MAG: AmmeMemoRadiSam system protein B [Chloroflexota bacterium]|nr:MAG: AmmeMemoRadiSam system protein B [Chloroflexota bacterium]